MNENINLKYAPLIELARNYCITVERAAEAERDEFVMEMVDLLPRLYLGFSQQELSLLPGAFGDEYLPQYLDQASYDNVRKSMEMLFGEEDTYLETFEKDMKYSDTPIAASISENLADIFQPLYDFVCCVKESEGMQTAVALTLCREGFQTYWSQIICNVMRPLNHLRFQIFEN